MWIFNLFDLGGGVVVVVAGDHADRDRRRVLGIWSHYNIVANLDLVAKLR
jgi:hypothetical protein